MRALVLAAFLVVALSGCISDTPPEADPAPIHDHPEPPAAEPWSLPLTRCIEAGFVAAYPREPIGLPSTSHVPEPWVLADVRDELGDPHISALGQPMLDDVTGHWHMAFTCDGFDLGWVGVSVEPPPFDHGGADRHLLLSGLSIGDDTVRQAVAAATGFEPNVNLRAEVMALAPALVYTINDDEAKGVYEGVGPVAPIYSQESLTVRWWLTVDDGEDHRPLSFDVHYLDGVTHGATKESVAPGCHTRTPMHGPQGGLCGPSIMVTYEAPAIHLTYNGMADAALEDAWHH